MTELHIASPGEDPTPRLERDVAVPCASEGTAVAVPRTDVRAALARIKKARRSRGRRGVALVMVLGTLTLLSVMLTEFQDATSAELASSVAARDQMKAEYAARSALNLTQLLIAAEPTIRVQVSMLTSMLGMGTVPQVPVWDYSDAILGAFGDEEGGAAFSNLAGLNLAEGRNLGLNGAGFRIQVVDEDSKINLNLAARADTFSQQRMAEQILALIGGIQYNPFFEELDADGNVQDRQTICGALIDWVDPNADLNSCSPRMEQAMQSGAEDSFYQLLKVPYRRKNAAFDSVDELRLVRGIGDDFWNTFIQPDPDDPDSRVATVWGAGPVNVNSANPQTMLTVACQKAVPDTPLCIDPVVQMQFLSALKLVSMFTPGIPLFSSPKVFIQALQGKGQIGMMMTAMQVPPVKFLSESEVEKTIAVKSSVFSVYATGYVRQGTRETRSRIHAVIDLRGAPPPGATEMKQQAAVIGAVTGADVSAITNLTTLPRPGGNILYYRVD